MPGGPLGRSSAVCILLAGAPGVISRQAIPVPAAAGHQRLVNTLRSATIGCHILWTFRRRALLSMCQCNRPRPRDVLVGKTWRTADEHS
jgi:hypothetical protein